MGEERTIPAPPRARHREGEILNELPNAAGLVLWQDVRHLRDWAESTPEVRACLFNPPSRSVLEKRRDARACAGEIAGALEVFAAMKVDPVNAVPAELGAACERVVEWALAGEHTHTAIEFAEAAGLVDPTNPKLANIAGRVTRNANEFDRAEVWFKRGIGLARERDDIVEQVWGHLGYGRLCQELGWVEGARKHLGRGSQLAWKEGPPSLAASAQHDLTLVLTVRGHLSEAAERAQRALLWYPKNHPRLPYFAADVGLLLVLSSRFAAAARLLRVVLRTIESPSARAVILALAASAFAGLGEPEESAVLRRRSLKMLDQHGQREQVARWHLADAQRLAGNWSAAESEANETLALAIARNDRETERMTRILIRLIEERRSARPKPTGHLRDFLRLLAVRVEEWSPRRGRNYPGPWGEDRAA
jgi:tetratricopeptide (TPR) repeat protein